MTQDDVGGRTVGLHSAAAQVVGKDDTASQRRRLPVVGASLGVGAAPVVTESNIQVMSRRYWQTRDPRLRETLVLYHQRLVHYIAARFVSGGEALEDLVQVGNIGLINALDRYDPSRDIRFSTYAMPTIVGEIKRHFRDKTWHVKVPRWLQELSANAHKAQHSLSLTLGYTPTVREIAAHLKASEDDVLEALEVSHISRAVSLDTRLDPQADGATLMDLLGRNDQAMYDVAAYSDLRHALEFLDEREREVLQMRFFEELSQASISRELGISQMHVSRLQQRALRRLRHLLTDEPLLSTRTSSRHSLPRS